MSKTAKRVLIVEDEPLIALDLAGVLASAGFEVIGPALDVSTALRLVSGPGCNAGVLDVNLGRETSAPVASVMQELGIPFVVVSGYSRTQRPKEFGAAPVLSKPVNVTALVTMLRELLGKA